MRNCWQGKNLYLLATTPNFDRLIHRDDDTAAKMGTRLASYHTHLEGIKGCFAPVLGVVNANQNKDKVFEHVIEVRIIEKHLY